MYLIKYEVIIPKNARALSKKWYGTKNDMYASIVLITSSKGFSSLVCKTHSIFTQTETDFYE